MNASPARGPAPSDSRPRRARVLRIDPLRWLWRFSEAPIIGLAGVVAVFVVLGWSFWEGHCGYDLNDEGYLWDGAMRTLQGEFPIRDFMAYDPGRYYWCAAIMAGFRDSGILTMRAAIGLFQAPALLVGLLLISPRADRTRFLALILGAVTLSLWMYPRHKIFDESIAILQVGLLTWWLTKPGDSGRWFLAGVGLGLIAVFGRNHGVYGMAGALGAIFWLALSRELRAGLLRNIVLWGVGVVAGFSPILLQCLLVPGYASAFLESVMYLVRSGSTNLPLPVPWPWGPPNVYTALLHPSRQILLGWCFVLLPLAGACGLCAVFLRRFQNLPTSPTIVAAFLMALPYSHYSFSRPEIMYMAHGILPCLVGGMCFLAGRGVWTQWTGWIFLAFFSTWIMFPEHPGWGPHFGNEKWETTKVGDDTLVVAPQTMDVILLLRHVDARFAKPGDVVYIAPLWPGAYPLLGRQSPVWENYAVVPRDAQFEKGEIARLRAARPAYAVIFNLAVDGREDLRFMNTHPLTAKYLQEEFVLDKNLSNSELYVCVPRTVASEQQSQ